jgi:choline monooxygenase
MAHATNGFDPTLYEVSADIRRAEGLPSAAFTDPAFLRRELETIFTTSWLLVPQRTAAEIRDDPRSLADLVRRRGARAPVSLLDRPMFLQRDWKGILRAFPNVCTHAWHTLVTGAERERAIVCPQHGRRFDTTGKYLSQPGFDGAVPGFPRACDDLQAMPTHEWHDLLFASLGTPRMSAREWLAPIQKSVAGLPMDRLKRQGQVGELRELAGNWKQHAWNYMDSSHIPFIHSRPGGLSEAIDLDSYQTELHGHAALQWAYARDPAHGFDPATLPKRFRSGNQRVFALWWFVFPNLTLNFYPWGLSVNCYAPVPTDPQKTIFLWYQWSWNEQKYRERDEIWQMKAVDDEDVDALGQVSRGVTSGFAPRGRFVPTTEAGPHWFHRRVYEEVASVATTKPRGRR